MKQTPFNTILSIAIFLSLASTRAAAPVDSPINPADYKPPIRVACLGDSITYGVGAGPGYAYPDQLDRMLGEGWDVRNFGHSGASVGKGDKHSIWNQKEYKNAKEFHPDVVVIMLGTNDTKPENWAAKKDFPKLYKELVVSFQKLSSKPRVFCCTAPYVGKKGAFGINEAGVLEQIPMIREVAADWGAAIVDVHAALDKKDELFKDNVHPSTEGATLIAKAVYKSLTGKDFTGEIPTPKQSLKSKPLVRIIENPGELSYKEAYGLIVTTGMPADKLEPARAKYEATEGELAAKIADLENQIDENDKLRMKFKYADGKQAGEYKAKVGALKKELEKLKREKLLELIALIPKDFRDEFGAQWVNKYILDRLAPITTAITTDQRKKIKELCAKEGEVYGNISNTPERSISDVETYKMVYEQVLDADQKRRVEPR